MLNPASEKWSVFAMLLEIILFGHISTRRTGVSWWLAGSALPALLRGSRLEGYVAMNRHLCAALYDRWPDALSEGC